MKRIHLFLTVLAFMFAAGVLTAGSAKATVWNIDAVLVGSGFGFAGFHRPGSDPRMGSPIGTSFSTTATGTLGLLGLELAGLGLARRRRNTIAGYREIRREMKNRKK